MFKYRIYTLLKKKEKTNIDQMFFGEKLGLTARFFGFWHQNLSRPFGEGKIAYRGCLNCSARRQFNTDTMKTHGPFFFPPANKETRV